MRLKQLVPDDFCLKCDICCRFAQENTVWAPRFTRSEVENLVRQNLLAAEDFKDFCPEKKNKPSQIKRIRLGKKGDFFACPCFNLDNQECKIYSQRPFECELYPFLLTKKGDAYFVAVDLQCPYADKFAQGKLKNYTEYLKAEFAKPENKSFLAKHKDLFSEYNSLVLCRVFSLDID